MSEPFDREVEDRLFVEFQRTGDRRVRNELVERYMGFATHVSQRFSRDHHDDDLQQAAMYGLVKAVDRFDPSRGVSFTTFAGVTIEGELKRHFRDKTWAVRVPRRAKELHLLVRDAGDELSARLGRSPSATEIADHLGVDQEDVLRGLSATAARNVGTIDSASPDADDAIAADRRAPLAVEEPEFERGMTRQLVDEAIAVLPDRERRIVELRFYDERSQSEIADEVGMSQMHVSRLLRRSFAAMRSHLDLTQSERDAAIRARESNGS